MELDSATAATAVDSSAGEKATSDPQLESSPAANPPESTLSNQNTGATPEGDASKTVVDSAKPADGATVDDEPPEGEGKPVKKKSESRILLPFASEEVDEIIKQAFTVVAKECESEEYDNGKVEAWKTIFEDYLVDKLNTSPQPFKFTVYVAVSQNSGDAMDVSYGGFFQSDFDGCVTNHWENEDVMVDVIVMAFSVQ